MVRPSNARLRQMWPEIVKDFEERYNAPAGVLPTDSISVEYASQVLEERR